MSGGYPVTALRPGESYDGRRRREVSERESVPGKPTPPPNRLAREGFGLFEKAVPLPKMPGPFPESYRMRCEQAEREPVNEWFGGWLLYDPRGFDRALLLIVGAVAFALGVVAGWLL